MSRFFPVADHHTTSPFAPTDILQSAKDVQGAKCGKERVDRHSNSLNALSSDMLMGPQWLEQWHLPIHPMPAIQPREIGAQMIRNSMGACTGCQDHMVTPQLLGFHSSVGTGMKVVREISKKNIHPWTSNQANC